MISILNAIKSVFVGNKEVQTISVGDAIVYQSGTYRISGTFTVRYSSGTKLLASGANYVELIATRETLRNGQVISTDEVVLTPVIGSSSFLYKEGNKIKAPSRGTTPGAERSDNVTATYDLGDGQTYDPQLSVQIVQQQNYNSIDHSEITSVKYFGQSSPLRITEYNTSSDFTISCTEKVGTYYYNWTSGESSTASITSWGANTDSPSWVTIESNTCNVTLAPYSGTSGGSRTAVINVFPSSDATNQYAYTIVQGVDYYLVFASGSSSTKTISSTATSGSIQVVSKHDGSAYAVTASRTGTWLTLGTITNSGATYTIPFTCSANSSSERTSTITISQSGGLSLTCTVTQEQANTALDGVTVATQGQVETANWVIGTIAETDGKKSLVIVRKSDWEYSSQSGSVTYSGLIWSGNASPGESYNNLYISHSSTVTSSATGKTYIGAYVKSTSGTDLKNQTNGDIYYITSFTE